MKKKFEGDLLVIGFTVIIVAATVIWAVVAPEQMASISSIFSHFMTWDLGWLLLGLGGAAVFFALYMAFGPYGNIKMGLDTDKPEHSYFSWFCMIVACGYATGLVYWGAAEPLTYFQAPPNGIEALSPEAASRALAQAFFHWGWPAWGLYMAGGIPFGYLMHRKGFSLNFGAMLKPIFGKRSESRAFKLVDGIVAYGIVAGLMTSAALGIYQLCGGLETMFGIPRTPLTMIIIVVVWASIYTWSAVSGIDKGIKVLSNTNIFLCSVIVLIVFVFNDPMYIMNMISSGLGTMLNEYFSMTFETDIIRASGVAQDWTAFNWFWFVAGAIPTGLFSATVSKGRTFKEFVLMHFCSVPILTWFWFGTFGATAIRGELNGMGMVETLTNQGSQFVSFRILDALPGGINMVAQILFVCLIVIFLVTTVDSYSYTLGQLSYTGDGIVPPKSLRIFWAASIATLVLVLVLVGEGTMRVVQSSQIIGGTIVIIFTVLLIVSMFKMLRQEKKPQGNG